MQQYLKLVTDDYENITLNIPVMKIGEIYALGTKECRYL